MIWKGNILFGTITDSECTEGGWRYHKIRFSNGEVYHSSLAHENPSFDPLDNWIRTDKVHKLNQEEMIYLIKKA